MEVDILNITTSNIIYVLLIIDSALSITEQITTSLQGISTSGKFYYIDIAIEILRKENCALFYIPKVHNN